MRCLADQCQNENQKKTATPSSVSKREISGRRPMGNPGTDPTILYERCLIEALKLELSRSEDEAEKAVIAESLRRVVMEEKVSQQMRREAAEVAAAGVN